MEIYYLNLENQFEVLPAVTNIECSLRNILFSAEQNILCEYPLVTAARPVARCRSCDVNS